MVAAASTARMGCLACQRSPAPQRHDRYTFSTDRLMRRPSVGAVDLDDPDVPLRAITGQPLQPKWLS